MDRLTRILAVCLAGGGVQACSIVPPPDHQTPGPAARKIVNQRSSAVVVTASDDLSHLPHLKLSSSRATCEADAGSATPISPDGYFLTADHVLERLAGRRVFVMYGRGANWTPVKARVVWRSSEADLALLHIPVRTAFYYCWTPRECWLPEGSGVIHGGIATGAHSESGKLGTSLAPEGLFTGCRKFKIDIPLQPGDSGGPVVDAAGALVGINSAVEYLVPMETAFFVDSEASRPNTRLIDSLVRKDRAARAESLLP